MALQIRRFPNHVVMLVRECHSQRKPKMLQTSCNGEDHCYCPSVGDCEIHRYVVTFTNLVHHNTHQGDHHREYYVTITVTNAASLTTTTTVDILLDESPPTMGVVWEGLSDDGQAEMDFTSSHVLHVRWHGFQDHESGIRLYRVLLAHRCMTVPEMEVAENATEVEQGNMATLTIPSEGEGEMCLSSHTCCYVCMTSVTPSPPLHLGVVRPLQDVTLHQSPPLSSVQCCPAPGSVLLYDVVQPPSARAYSKSFPPSGLPICTPLGPSVVLHSRYTSSTFPFLFWNVFYDVSYLRSFLSFYFHKKKKSSLAVLSLLLSFSVFDFRLRLFFSSTT